MSTRLALACWCAVLFPLVSADAQIIRVKPLPVAEGEQFTFQPSAGFAGVSIALPDTLLDPFVNPATGGRTGTKYFGAPSFFSVSGNSGAGTTFPIGAYVRRGSSFAAFAAAIQQIHHPQRTPTFFGGPSLDVVSTPPQGSSESLHNSYSFALLGHTLETQRLSFAGSVMWSGLGAVDGVDQFYERRDWLRQRGEALDVRMGLLKQSAKGASYEVLLLRNRFRHMHDVGFMDPFWDPARRQPVGVERIEHSGEHTETWGAQLEYARPLRDTAWRAGAVLIANRISHPRIPGYELFEGFGREGRSTAYNIGVGIARSVNHLAFGVDAIYEPISSHTNTPDTLSNRFNFSNAKLRAGLSKSFALLDPGSALRFHLGAEFYAVSYVMNGRDLVRNTDRYRKERWLERTRSLGMSFKVPGIEVHYQLRSRSGVGRPGVMSDDAIAIPVAPLESSFVPFPLPAPSPTLGSVRVTWHQFVVSIPRS